ncbi:hypothetical protein [Sphingopyxis bauzanensis]|nr:hypothetical protein [Sphingopyxis bauzanensis]GGJ52795.1 hypothetical protein GCM10011393_23780 [Sphingopyxis bauzanensis]
MTTYVRDSLAKPYRSTVRVLTDSVATGYSTDIGNAVANDLIESLSTIQADKPHKLILHRDTKCSIDKLQRWWKTQGFAATDFQVQSEKNIRKILKMQWEADGHHWRVNAVKQASAFEGNKLSIEAWVEQFGKFGQQSVGRKLAAQLRVVRPMEMQCMPFALRPTDIIGLGQANCYVEDDDIGGSWLDIKACLSHTHPKGTVHPVVWNKAEATLKFPSIDVDQFVLYEDGLWTGTEGVRRLKALQKAPPNARVILKFGIVSDFGLHVLRHAISKLGLADQVHIDASASEFMKFLRDGLPEELLLGREMSLQAYFEALHKYTIPHAFDPFQDWSPAERDLCREIGSQLVAAWLGKKNGIVPSTAELDRFALGGSGFASTTLFARSVPKVCLPALWLDGQVSIGEKVVNWRPLFVDARRISDTKLLFAAPSSES